MASASKRQSKKRKRDGLMLADQEIVTVSVEPRGEEPHQFKIHKRVLCSHSSRFRDLFEDEVKTKVTTLSEVSVETFETFSKWLYTKELVVDEMEQEMEEASDASDASDASSENTEDSNNSGEQGNNSELDDGDERDGSNLILTNGMQEDQDPPGVVDGETISDNRTWYARVNRKGRVFARLLDLYIFADTYKAVSFKRVVMLGFQRFIAASETLPCPTIVKHALDNLDFKSPMCKYLAICYGHYTDFKKVNKDRFATLSSTFLTEVLLITFRRIDDTLDDSNTIDDWDDNWCDYHEHESDQGRKECENERPEDDDIVKRRPKRRRWGGCC